MKTTQLFINGEWQDATIYYDLLSPYNGEVIARVPKASKSEVEAAIDAAFHAKEKIAHMPAYEKAEILEKVCQLLQQRKEEAARLIATEGSKPIKNAYEEVERTIQTYKFAAEEAKRILGETIKMDAVPGGVGKVAYTVREPLGVIAAITPFNFPLNLVAHKVGPAVAAGNSIVLKPASQTPLSAYFIAGLFKEAGLPDGVLNVVTGSGKEIGDVLVTSDKIKAVTFTGSKEVGIGIRNKAGLKRVTLELGSNAALLIDKEVDVKKMIPKVIKGAFSNQGQLCISVQRIFVHESMFDLFVDSFVDETKKLRIGDPLHKDTDVAALISESDVKRVSSWVSEAKENGAIVACGGEIEGNVITPTILLHVNRTDKVSCQEVFAPVVVINSIASIEEGIEQVNESSYGLQAGIFTNDIFTAMNAAEKLHVGGVMINEIPTFRVDHMPYGGVKESGIGREGIKYAIEEMMELKLVVINKN